MSLAPQVPLVVPWILQEIEWITEELRLLLSEGELAAYRRRLLVEFRSRCAAPRPVPVRSSRFAGFPCG